MTEVIFGSRYKPCNIAGDGLCKYCHKPILWGQLLNGKYIPLEFDAVEPGVMEPHFGKKCRPQTRAAAPEHALQDGIQMSETIWRQLLRLIHPDKHHGTADERLANDLTGWLLDQRAHLKEGAKQ